MSSLVKSKGYLGKNLRMRVLEIKGKQERLRLIF